MTVVVAASAQGSPGVSTAVQLVAAQWVTGETSGSAAPDEASRGTRVPTVVEADASGGVCAARFGLSLSPGLVTLAESLRKSEAPELTDHAQRMPSGVAVVPLSPSSTAARAQLKSVASSVMPYLAATGHPVLVDVGRLTPDARLANALVTASAMVWFTRPTREDLVALRYRMAECPQPRRVGIVLVGDAPYSQSEVEDSLETAVLHTLPFDVRGAAAANLGGNDRYLRRSRLARSCAVLAKRLAEIEG